MKEEMELPTSYAIEDYLASGCEETENPFITEESRKWGKHVSLIGAIGAAFFLFTAYVTEYFSLTLSHFFLLFVYFLTGTPAIIRSISEIKSLNINIQVLMTLAAFLSFIIGGELEGGLLLVLFALSEALEDLVMKKTKGALHSLQKLSPTMAYVVEQDGSIYPKSVREITLDTVILVKAGEIVPLDGEIIEGSSFISLAHLTGESVPIPKKPKDTIPAGSMNIDGVLTIQVKKTSKESSLAKIIQLITQAQASKPRLQKLLDRFGRTYATSVIAISAAFAIFLPLIFSIPYLSTEGSIYRSLAFLIAASPCALIIATPTAYLAAISTCARKGVLLKGGIVLDALSRCKKIAFDKTGTLTTGKLTCADITCLDDYVNEQTALSVAAGLEKAAIHPIAQAIEETAQKKQTPLQNIEEITVIAGNGITGVTEINQEKVPVCIGSKDFILEKISDAAYKDRILEQISHEGHVVTLLLVKDCVCIFHFTDEMRENAKEILQELKKDFDIILLTGDHDDNAQHVAQSLGIEHIYANLQPEDKLKIIKDLAEKHPMVMVGDGLNDAPSLVESMVGIAMGQIGSQTAVDAADIVLLRDDISVIHWLYKKAVSTVSIVKQNVIFALAVIGLATTLSIFGIIPLWLAVVMHEGSTVLVGMNSMRLLRA